MLNPVEKSIGATARDHSTISGWESDTDDNCVTGFGSGDYSDPCSPVGVCYDDADFNENVIISGATTSEDYHRKLTVAVGERHNGAFPKSDVGVKILGAVSIINYDNWFELEWVIMHLSATGDLQALYIQYVNSGTTLYIRNIIVDNADYTALGQIDGGLSYTCEIENSIFIARLGGGSRAVQLDGSPSTINMRNCVEYYAGGGFGAGNGYHYNCIAIGGPTRDAYYLPQGGDYNIGGIEGGGVDTSAPGANSIDSIDPADLFMDITDGAEDLHLKDGATSAAGGGDDLSAYFTIDIDGDTRVNWDIGADEYTSVSSGVTINCTTGAIEIAGIPSEIIVGTDIQATTGEINLEGITAEVEVGTTISCLTGQIDLEGVSSNIIEGINIDCTTGSLELSGVPATIDLGLVINCTTGEINLEGIQATVIEGIDINCSTGEIELSGVAAFIDLGVTINCATGSIEITGEKATIEAGTIIEASTGQINIEGVQAIVEQPTIIDCSTGQIYIEGIDAEIIVPVIIDANTGEIEFVGISAEIIVGAIPEVPLKRVYPINEDNRVYPINEDNRVYPIT